MYNGHAITTMTFVMASMMSAGSDRARRTGTMLQSTKRPGQGDFDHPRLRRKYGLFILGSTSGPQDSRREARLRRRGALEIRTLLIKSRVWI